MPAVCFQIDTSADVANGRLADVRPALGRGPNYQLTRTLTTPWAVEASRAKVALATSTIRPAA